MFENLTNVHQSIFDEILSSRRSVRAFSSNAPEQESINEIIKAGIIAPFAAIPAAGRNDFRKFFVIPSSSDEMKRISGIVMARIPAFAVEMEKQHGNHPYVATLKQAVSVTFVRILGNAPYLIIAAERKGLPEISEISLSYCMHNMWLKATSLKIGYRLLAIFSQLQLGNDKELCNLLGLKSGEFTLDACTLGFPSEDFSPPPVNYPDFKGNVKWLGM